MLECKINHDYTSIIDVFLDFLHRNINDDITMIGYLCIDCKNEKN